MRKTSLSLIALISLSLSGCGEVQTFKLVTGTMTAAMYDVFKREDVNLRAKNHAAADYIESRMNGFVGKRDPIAMRPLTQTDNAAMTSPLGRNIPEGIGMRLHELGYTVLAPQMSDSNQPVKLAGDNSKYTLGGTYLRGKTDVDINLRVFETESGRLIAAFDYKLPLSREVKELSNTETRIFRVQK